MKYIEIDFIRNTMVLFIMHPICDSHKKSNCCSNNFNVESIKGSILHSTMRSFWLPIRKQIKDRE